MPVSIVVAFSSKNFGIGRAGALPWNIPEDLRHFSEVTKGGTVVMGRNTYESIPEEKRPLRGRKNIVLTNQDLYGDDKREDAIAVYNNIDKLRDYVIRNRRTEDIYIIGGASIYKKFMYLAETIYATVIDKSFEDMDTFFPVDHCFEDFHITKYSDMMTSAQGNCNYRFITYERGANTCHQEYGYLDLMQMITTQKKRPDRTGVGTHSSFGHQMRFDISKSIPLVTTKFVPFKSVVKELLWFLRGETDSKILEGQGVNIWKANTTREFLDNRGLQHYREGDLGPLYGFNLRHFGAKYEGCDHDYRGQGYDQVAELIQGLRNDPFSRRHLLTTYNPGAVKDSVLAPCHGIAINFYVDEDEDGVRELSCHVYNRSQDMFLGVPFNIASYAVLVYIIAAMVDMKPKDLVLSTGDTHVYNNHIDQVKRQLGRRPLPFPTLTVHESVKTKKIEDITVDDFELVGYLHHPSISAPMAV
jgi:dihydrofolate reductase / thymidylate synthase